MSRRTKYQNLFTDLVAAIDEAKWLAVATQRTAYLVQVGDMVAVCMDKRDAGKPMASITPNHCGRIDML